MSAQLTRRATLRWTNHPPRGVGRLGVASGAFAALPISLAEVDPHPRETTPGELLASALSAYLGMHLALRMEREGTDLRELVIETELSVSPWPDYTTERVSFTVRGRALDRAAPDPKSFASATAETLSIAMDNLGLDENLSTLVDTELL
jgi:organic hydroperoxide reductase OsmC/OhrA